MGPSKNTCWMDKRRSYCFQGICILNRKADNEKINYPLMIVIQAQEAISRVCDGADAKDHIDNNIRDNVSTET